MDKKLKNFTIFAFIKAWITCILCLVISISHANPVEFWLAGTDTFNQKDECSIYPVCFCQTFGTFDIAIFDIVDPSDTTNYLLAFFNDGTLWNTFNFSPTGFDHHQSLSITDWSAVVDKKLIFKVSNVGASILAPNTSWTDMPPSTAFGKSGTDLSRGSIDAFPLNCAAKQLLQNTIPSGTSISFVITFTISGGAPASNSVIVEFYDSDPSTGNIIGIQTFTVSDGTYVNTVNIILTGDAQYLVIRSTVIVGPGKSVTITLQVGAPLYYATLAQSDCVEITDNEDFICTKLISYSNSTDIAGLGFPSSSPSVIYYLRIPAIFFEEQFPQEQEDLELSSDEIVTLWSKMEAKKLLDIGFMPFYMHKKLQLIMMMDYLSIDGIEYRKRDPYTISEGGSKRHALRRAQVLLSEKDFITRNLL